MEYDEYPDVDTDTDMLSDSYSEWLESIPLPFDDVDAETLAVSPDMIEARKKALREQIRARSRVDGVRAPYDRQFSDHEQYLRGYSARRRNIYVEDDYDE